MLPYYCAFMLEAERVRQASVSLSAFTDSLRGDSRVTRKRNLAREELQGFYDFANLLFGMRDIPVYLPIRKKIRVKGNGTYFTARACQIGRKRLKFQRKADLA